MKVLVLTYPFKTSEYHATPHTQHNPNTHPNTTPTQPQHTPNTPDTHPTHPTPFTMCKHATRPHLHTAQATCAWCSSTATCTVSDGAGSLINLCDSCAADRDFDTAQATCAWCSSTATCTVSDGAGSLINLCGSCASDRD